MPPPLKVLVTVQDVRKDEAFDEAIKDMGAVIHSASPFRYDAENPEELIEPAVNGTTSVLQSILKNAPQVKRVVIASSVAAVIPPSRDASAPPKTYSEKDWNQNSSQTVTKESSKVSGIVAYFTSKTEAEIAAWKLVDEHKDEIGRDLVTLLPCYIFGPIIHKVSSPSALNTSSAMLLDFFKNEPPKSPADLAKDVGSFVDVRDLAWAHAEAP
ncbi:hypothetical protein M422DRAFT_774853 [Sphaerobolus stellatus SS14]|nr:hypothetical protein M422DRAFT_774853 [Sphaerobolus stellatus SS14]